MSDPQPTDRQLERYMDKELRKGNKAEAHRYYLKMKDKDSACFKRAHAKMLAAELT